MEMRQMFRKCVHIQNKLLGFISVLIFQIKQYRRQPKLNKHIDFQKHYGKILFKNKKEQITNYQVLVFIVVDLMETLLCYV